MPRPQIFFKIFFSQYGATVLEPGLFVKGKRPEHYTIEGKFKSHDFISKFINKGVSWTYCTKLCLKHVYFCSGSVWKLCRSSEREDAVLYMLALSALAVQW